MSFIQNFFTSRDNNANTETYVGQTDRLWFNPDNNTIRVSDGSTPGGLPVDLSIAANANINSLIANTGRINGNLIVIGNISPAAVGKIGGIQPGPGANISNTGLLTIDTTGLPLSFGNFTANNNVLTIVNMDEDMILQTQGNAELQLVGNIGFYKPNGIPPNVANRYFQASSDGQIKILVSNVDPTTGAVEIIGSTSGLSSSTENSGVMLHVTGQNGIPSRIYNDSVANFAAFVGRRINGTVASPSPVVAGDELIRISSTGYNGTTVSGNGSSRIVFQAMENFTVSNTGSNLSFWTAAIGSNTLVKIATIDNANGLVATKVVSTGNANVGNLGTGGQVIATGNVTGGNLVTAGSANVTGNVNAGNVTATNYTGKVTHSIRDAGAVGGSTLTLNVTTDDIVHCTFTDNFTIAFANIIAGRVVTLLATNTSGADTDIITAGISSVNMQGDNTITVTEQTTAVITYYSLDTTTGNIFASAVYN